MDSVYSPTGDMQGMKMVVKEGSDKGSDSDRDDGGFSQNRSPKNHWVGDVF